MSGSESGSGGGCPVAVTLISPTAYARHRKCDEKAVRQAVLAGRISTIGGMIDAAVADIQWMQNTRARVNRRATPSAAADEAQASILPSDAATGPSSAAAGADPGYANHRSRREAADAERAELETAKLAGRLVDRERVEAAVFDAFRTLRDRALAVPRRCAPSVVGMVEAREIELAFLDELRLALGADEAVAVAAIQLKVLAQ